MTKKPGEIRTRARILRSPGIDSKERYRNRGKKIKGVDEKR
jgi:hypothetical protein